MRFGLTILVWRLIRPWVVSPDIRLGTDCLYWISPPDALVGRRQCRRRSCAGHVDHSPFVVYATIHATPLHPSDEDQTIETPSSLPICPSCLRLSLTTLANLTT